MAVATAADRRQSAPTDAPQSSAGIGRTPAAAAAAAAADSGRTRRRTPLVDGVAGFGAGLIATALLHPLDLIKTRFQVQHAMPGAGAAMRYSGTLDAFRTILRAEGGRGLYAGMAPNLLAAGLSWGAYFGAYEMLKAAVAAAAPPLAGSLGGNLTAASAAGVLVVLATNPLWLIKTRMQLQPATAAAAAGSDAARRYRGTWDAVRTIAREEGIRGFYRGTVPSLLGVSHAAVQFAAYEECKRRLAAALPPERIGPAHYFVAGAVAKVVAAVTTYPYQVVRSRLQARPPASTTAAAPRYRGLADVIRSTWRLEGIRGFYRGLGPGVLRVVPAAAITFASYEWILQLLSGSSSAALPPIVVADADPDEDR